MSHRESLRLPFTQRWLTENIHHTDLLGQRHAIDFVGVDEHGRTARVRDWRTMFTTEPPERFFGFGRPILAPGDGVVVGLHDGEVDHEARRSQLTLAGYALGQASRLRQGLVAVTGNYVTIALRDSGKFVTLCHLRRGSLIVGLGDPVTAGQQIAECGNSGNSTQPHLHLQLNDRADWDVAVGLPAFFRDFREWRGRDRGFQNHEFGRPEELSVVEPL